MRQPGRARPFTRLVRLAGVALVAAAIAQELRKQPQDRTWTGTLGGFVPYDFRPPTLARLRERMWAPDEPRIFTPNVFGVGWTVNVGRLARLADTARAEVAPPGLGGGPLVTLAGLTVAKVDSMGLDLP